ncbi:hypothetical protein HZA99_03665 [Candidatus Woesearchaeota archaeon]|nr:hypothetical protein [Candidatus Woesearchaeota archaeon]
MDGDERMDSSKLKYVIMPSNTDDLNQLVLRLRKQDAVFSSTISTFSLLEDSKMKQEPIFKINATIKNKGAIPKFCFLK